MPHPICFVHPEPVIQSPEGDESYAKRFGGIALMGGAAHVQPGVLVKAADIPNITAHSLRHTCASLRLPGVHPGEVSERRGHSSITVTLDTYSHLLPAMRGPAAHAMSSIFSGAGAGATALFHDTVHHSDQASQDATLGPERLPR